MSDVETKQPSREVVERGTMKARDIRIGQQGINFTNAGEVMAFANMMAQSGFAVRKEFRDNPGACLAIIDDAIRFGVSPYALARGAYLVNDQLAYESKIIAAVIIGRAAIRDLPDYVFAGEGQEMRCTVSVTLASGKVIEHSSPPVGQITPRNSPLWKSDPQQQLGYYTIRAMARRHFPHTLAGIYDLEEAAAARAIDVTRPSPSGLAERLTGQKGAEGFDVDMVDQSLNGDEDEDEETEEGGKPDAVAETAETEDRGDAQELTEDDHTLIADLAAEFATATTEIEVASVLAVFAEQIDHGSAALKAEIEKRRGAKLAKIAKTAKKKG